jgi:hypothetical protein
MAYKQSGALSMLVPTERTLAVGHAITDAVGDRLWLNIRQNTPVGPVIDVPGYVQVRKPGTLRKSIYRLPVLRTPKGWEVTAATDDPIAEYVEWDTTAHYIYPRYAMQLRFPYKGALVFRDSVFHPGTHGQHMFAIGTLITDSEWPMIGRGILDAWAAGGAVEAVAGEEVGAEELVGAEA